MSAGFWDDAPVIHTYTRAQALADGTLIDLTDLARQFRFPCPVAIAAHAYADAIAWDPANDAPNDETGRTCDVLTVALLAAHAAGRTTPTVSRVEFQVHRIPNEPHAIAAEPTVLALHVGRDDDGETVLTITAPADE